MLRPLTKWQTSSAGSGVVAGTFERLRHEDNLQAGVVRDVLRILDVAQEDDIAQAVHLGIGANTSMAFLTSFWENDWPTSASIFSRTCHLGQVASVLRVEPVFAACALVAKLRASPRCARVRS